MVNLKKLTISLLFTAIPVLFFGQNEKPDYSLLWEISGKDLSGPSFLFGTMHLRDERVFEFSDSVLIALRWCDAFAMEVHPDSAISYVLDLMLSQDTTNYLRDMLSEEAYRELDQLILEREGKSIDSLESKKPELLERMLMDFSEPVFTKKKPQILDLFLFGYAKEHDKALYGVEHMREYKNLTGAFFRRFEKKESDAGELKNRVFNINNFIESYRAGDLGKIEETMRGQMPNGEYRTEMLTNRNQRMVEKFVALGSEQSLFCAVGAAHLPGSDGMLAMFKDEGYSVRRVTPSFTGVADSLLSIKMPQKEGVPFVDYNAGFACTLPSTPIFQPIEQSAPGPDGNLIDLTGRMYLTMDLLSGNQFMLMQMDYPASLVLDNKKTAFDAVEEEYELIWGPKVGEPKEIIFEGLSAREMTFDMKGMYIHLIMTARGNRFFVFAVMYPAGSDESMGNAFLESVKILPIEHTDLDAVDIPEIGCHAAMPANFEVVMDTALSYQFPDKMYTFCTALDPMSAWSYIVLETKWSEYYEVEDPDSFLVNYKRDLELGIFTAVTDTVFKSLPAYYIENEDNLNQFYSKTLVLLTDEREYELTVNSSVPDADDRIWEFYHSFETPQKWTGKLLEKNITPKLLEDLSSTDSLVSAGAKAAAYYHKFKEEDIDGMLALLEEFDTSGIDQWEDIHVILIDGLDAHEDDRILPFLKTYYTEHDGHYEVQISTLEAMLGMETEEGNKAFFDAAIVLDTAANETYSYFYFSDSLILQHLPEIIELRKHPVFKDNIYSSFITYLNVDSNDISIFQPFSKDLLADSWEIVNKYELLSYKDSLPYLDIHWTFSNMLSIAGFLEPNSGSVEFLKSMQSLPDEWMLASVAKGLLKQNEKVNKGVFKKISEDHHAWYSLVSGLNNADLKLVPKKLLSLENFIKGGILDLSYGDIIEIENFKIIEKRPYQYANEELWLYVYSFQTDYDPETTYLGICSQPQNGELSVSPSLFNFSYTAFNQENKEEIITEILSYFQ